MDLTFEGMKSKVLRLIGDEADPNTGSSSDYGAPLSGVSYKADLLKDGVHAALDALAQRYWKSAVKELDANGASFRLPGDLIEIEGVRDLTTGLFLPSTRIASGKSTMVSGVNAWMEFPTGTLTLVNALGAQGGRLYYSATWAKPVDDGDSVEPPDVTATAISLFAASYVLLNAASVAGSLAQYRTRVDSGNPTDNPLNDLSVAFLKRFEIEMARLPSKEKGHSN